MASSSAAPPLQMNNPADAAQYALNTKIMVAAIVVLFIAVFVIMALHIYAKWYWRRPSSVAFRRNFTWIRRRHVFMEVNPSSEAQCVGLDRSAIDALPTFTYQRISQDKEAPVLDCAVCLSELQDGEKVRILPNCKHSFHTDCIDMWFQCHSTCPMCRTPILPSAVRAQAASSDPMLSVNARTGTMTHQQAEQDEPAAVALQVSSSSSTSPSLQAHLGSSSTRSLPQLAIGIPACCQQVPNLAALRSASLSLLHQSVIESQVGTSSHPPLRSASLKVSIKRLLSRDRSSRGRRVFPSSSREGELDNAVDQDFVTISRSPV